MKKPFFTAGVFWSLLLCTTQLSAVDTGSISETPLTDSVFGVQAEEVFSIHFRQASLREALQLLSRVAKVNIIIPEGIEGLVTVHFRDVAVKDALNAIVKANALDYTVEGGVIRIAKGDAFKETGENLQTETFHLNYATSKNMVSQVQSLLSSRGSVFADDRTNSLVVRDLPANIENAGRFLDRVDVRDAQVLIESKILEVTRTFSRALGIQWGVTKPGSRVDLRGLEDVGAAQSDRNLNVDLPAASPSGGVGLILGRLAGGTQIDLQISAAEARGDAYVISDPSIVTSNGMLAEIRSGTTLLINAQGDINIGSASSTSAAGGGSGLQQIETGVQLNVTPQISRNDYVKLTIEAVTSQPDFTRAVQGLPSIIDNTAKTTVLVKDGETTVIGGLTRFSESDQKNEVPGFARIPLIGNLFRSKSRRKENTELMVLVKPTIVTNDGTLPVQMRVRSIEKRRDAMYLEPLSDPLRDEEKKMKREMRKNVKSGNKYTKMRPPNAP
ncbi:MAG: hypothetical protein A3I05_05525 [Deltaproteobacteria bacterium RIFCSPLOWO2_02_FULL_44_10]|nr:MAG: hypothetical protein A3C46_06275 [Deltaproteobacteria bacterium RIFCSPHIGHO2_02_FULL_44_16]OGQ46044.1 MAG: hypothetical protein A3I05_05525 [Deltaproteobacteria bacterium RIFCSPLOWO2_02_FULL_44_10]